MIEKLNFLKNVHLFHDIPEDYIKILVKGMELKKYTSGERIIQEGEKGDSLFFLFEGEVSVTKKMTLFAEYQEQSLFDKALIKLKDTDHAFFGEMSMCSDCEERSATVTAERDCILGELPAIKIHKLVLKHIDFGMKFYKNLANVLADRLRKTNKDVLKLTTALTLALEE